MAKSRGSRLGRSRPAGEATSTRSAPRRAASRVAARCSDASAWRGRPRNGAGPGAGKVSTDPGVPARRARVFRSLARPSTSRSWEVTTISGCSVRRRAASGRAGPKRPEISTRSPRASASRWAARRASVSRPANHVVSKRVATGSPADALQHRRRGSPRHDLHAHHPAPRRLHFFPADDRVLRPVGPLHEDVGDEGLHHLQGRRLVVDDDAVDRLQGEQRLRALRLRHRGPALALHPAHGAVGVDRHHEHVAFGAGGLQQGDVAGMEEVEAAVGEDDPAAALPPSTPLLDQLGQRLRPELMTRGSCSLMEIQLGPGRRASRARGLPAKLQRWGGRYTPTSLTRLLMRKEWSPRW